MRRGGGVGGGDRGGMQPLLYRRSVGFEVAVFWPENAGALSAGPAKRKRPNDTPRVRGERAGGGVGGGRTVGADYSK